MARARNIKPSIMANEELAELEPLSRLLFIYLWMLADKAGRLEDRPKRIKAMALPYDDLDTDGALNGLARAGFIQRYEVAGERFIQITTFDKHQTPHVREQASTFPGLPEILTVNESPKEGKGDAGSDAEHNLGSASPSPRSPDSGFSDSGFPDSLIGVAAAPTAPPAPPPSPTPAPTPTPAPSPAPSPAPAPQAAEKAPTGSRLPTDWTLPEAFAEFCRAERPDLDPFAVADRFRDYWVAQPGKDGRKTDWLATWRNWVRNQKSGIAARRAGPSRPTSHTGLDTKNYSEGVNADGTLA